MAGRTKLPVTLLMLMVTAALCHEATVPDSLKSFSTPFSSQQELWVYALASTCLISIAPFVILFFIPINSPSEHSSFLKVLLSFASGGLLGDAFLHLIPHAIGGSHEHHSHDHHHHDDHHHDHHHDDHHHDHHHHHHSNEGHSHDHMRNMIAGLWVLSGIMAFLVVEKFVRLLKGGHKHVHFHDEIDNKKNDGVPQNKKDNGGDGLRQRKDTTASIITGGKGEDKKRRASTHKNIKVSGYLNLVADFAHNFTDGLAIGASYLAGRGVGMVTTFTILLHEVPHEIGDFAILIQSGHSKRRAMLLQLVTAVGAIMGTVLGLMAEGGGVASSDSWILLFTAGGFIYIATVSVIPELLEDSSSFIQSIMEFVAMGTGVGMMVAIIYLE